MKKWLRFFLLSFFSDKEAREGARRGYTNAFVALILAFVLLWAGFFGADILPFSVHYNNSPEFMATVHKVFANTDVALRIYPEINEDNRLLLKWHGEEYKDALFVNTYISESDRENYSVNGYSVIVDTRSASTLAEVEAYCISNDGENTIISYEEYLTLSSVARLNFDFKLRFTGDELLLTDELISTYKAYIDGKGGEIKASADSLSGELSEGKITADEYNRAIYELYFSSYYPGITEYESTSKVPLLRNYYYREYVEGGDGKYLFIFDDCIAGAFVTAGGVGISFYGFFGNVGGGALIDERTDDATARERADDFIKEAFHAGSAFSAYAHAMNVFSLIPFIALMPMVVTLLVYSLLKLRGVKSVSSLGATFKIVSSYVWMSGVISALVNVIISFIFGSGALVVMPLLLFFIILTIRALIFAIIEIKLHTKGLGEQLRVRTEE